jgi:hypothetical protein
MTDTYQIWLGKVRSALQSINMPFDDWQKSWPFDFEAEHRAGTEPASAAERANRFWWHEQNQSIGQDCRRTPNCWLPRNHQGECQPRS